MRALRSALREGQRLLALTCAFFTLVFSSCPYTETPGEPPESNTDERDASRRAEVMEEYKNDRVIVSALRRMCHKALKEKWEN